MLMGAQAQRKFKQLKLSVIEARDLPLFKDIMRQGLFTGGKTIEPFFTCNYAGGKALATNHKQVVTKDNVRSVNKTFWIPLLVPRKTRMLQIEVKDD
jgi:hypothetical protein